MEATTTSSAGTLEDLREENIETSTRFKSRVCNSDDAGDISSDTSSSCVKPTFPYKEVRIAPGNWDSSILIAWIYQILLSEVFGVPVTIEVGDGRRTQDGSFYDSESRFTYPDESYPVEYLVEADRVDDGDCLLTDKPCAHIMPEVWDSSVHDEISASITKPTKPNGIVGTFRYFIPAYTANRHREMISFYGLHGDDNRRKLADTFKEPTTWVDYCESVDKNNCTLLDANDGISRRYPATETEKYSYFVPSLYSGHFRVTDRNNCTANPKTCTGNVIGPHCSWSTYVDTHMHWNDIGLTSNGPLTPNNGYSYSHMVQIWRAANATKSDVFMWWWLPDMLPDEFVGEDYAFQSVTLPAPNGDCITYRETWLSADGKCSEDIEVRRGEAIGSCDYDPTALQKVISRGLKTSSSTEGVEALRSPAFESLDGILLSSHSLSRIVRKMTKLLADNGTVYDTGFAARESVCEWVYDNYESLARQSPKGFPREKALESYTALSYTGYVLGSIALVLAMGTAVCVNLWKDHQIIKSSQLNVLIVIITGYVLAGLSSVLHAVVETSDSICTLQQWTLRLCYCLEFVPTMLKISSINKLGQAARLFRKVQVDPNIFKKYLVISVSVIVVYLAIWTVVDMPQRVDDFKIIEGEVDTVAFYAGCASSSPAWGAIALGLEGFVLLGTTILAYQSREIIKNLNESHWLGFLLYSHSVFLIIRVVVKVLLVSGMIVSAMSTKVMSIVVALETIAAILVYFLPKFVIIKSKKPLKEAPVMMRGGVRKGNGRGSSGRGSGRRFITGIKIPDGGIPNLIKKKAAVDERATGLYNFGRQETARTMSTTSLSSNLMSTRTISTLEDDAPGEGASAGNLLRINPASSELLSTTIPEDTSFTGMENDAEVDRLRGELRKSNDAVDMLTRENYEHKRRMESIMSNITTSRRGSMGSLVSATSAPPPDNTPDE